MKQICVIVGIVLGFSSAGLVYCGLSSGSVQRPKTRVPEDLVLKDSEKEKYIKKALKIVCKNQEMSPFAYSQLWSLIPKIKKLWDVSLSSEFGVRNTKLSDLIVKVNKLNKINAKDSDSNVEESKLFIQTKCLKNVLCRIALNCESMNSSEFDKSPDKDSNSGSDRDFENELNPLGSMSTMSSRTSSIDGIFELEL